MTQKGLNTLPYCTSELKTHLSNYWFSPYVPSRLLSVYTICKTYNHIITIMIKKGYTLWRFAIVYMYEVTFQLMLNTAEQLQFKTCIPDNIVNTPPLYCTNII